MFNGSIQGIGPRYCPSIEDKVARFADKSSHPIFLEPEGWRTTELYVQGMSTSLPRAVQDAALRTIPALRDVSITRYGYAVEYDAVDPSELTQTLETRRIASLFFAGQINGTSGYEEAAGQGLIAGINAAASVKGQSPLVLRRDQAYLGVMIDDLISKPFEEPYRMLTSRAEFRLSLRPSTADRRLGALAAERGLISRDRLSRIERESDEIRSAVASLCAAQLTPSSAHSDSLRSAGIEPLARTMSAAELLRRPEVTIEQLAMLVLDDRFPALRDVSPRIREMVEEEVKYGAFVERERREVDRRAALEHRELAPTTNYADIPGLRYEASSKLTMHRPRTIGEASRLSGVTPSDIAALLIHATRTEASAS
jgi:tRNA uridine 5-carboxymethylaminomethyl modification enzyme